MSGAEEREEVPPHLGALPARHRLPVPPHVDLRRPIEAPERDKALSVFEILKRLLAVTRTMSPSPEVRGNTMQVVVTDVSKNILPADASRRFMLIQNNHATATVKIAFGAAATLTTGINLAANGGSLLIDSVNMPTCDVYAIGSVTSNPSVVVVVA